MKNAYRVFCLKDSSNNNLPFSSSYISNNFEEFKKSLGIKATTDETQFRIDDNDECLYIGVEFIETNSISISSKIIDIDPLKESIKVNNTYADFEPGLLEKSTAKTKSNKSKIIFFSLIGVGVVVIGALIAIIVVVIVRKRKQHLNENSSLATIGQTSVDETDNYM